MKVCLLAYKFYDCSPSLRQFASCFTEHGHEVDLICLGRENQPKSALFAGVQIWRLQQRVTNETGRLTYLIRILKFFFRAMIFLSKKHLERRYELIHVQCVPDFLVFAAVLPRILGVPIILDMHDIVPEFYASKFNCDRHSAVFKCLVLIEKASAGFALHVISPTHLWKERLESRSLKRGKCTTIRYLPDPRMFYPREKTTSNERILIVYPGTLNAHQGVDVAIKAFARIAPEIPHAEFHIYGEGPAKPHLVDLIQRLGMADKVKLSGMLPKEQIVELMAQSDLAIEPKLVDSPFANETCSVKLLEFLALGVPVIASRTYVHGFYYNDGMIRFYDGDRPEDLADAILQVVRDKVLRQKLASNGLKYIGAHNWMIERQKYLRIVGRLQSRRNQNKERTLTGCDAPLANEAAN